VKRLKKHTIPGETRCHFFFILFWGLWFSSTVSGVRSSSVWFEEITDDIGLAGTSAARIAAVDLNDDDYPDLFIHGDIDWNNWDVLNRMQLFLNVPAGNPEITRFSGNPDKRLFVDYTRESGITANRRGDGTGRHASLGLFGDIDNDGDVDYFSGVYYHRHTFLPENTDDLDWNDLFLNDGTGRFAPSEETVFFDAGPVNTTSAVFTDIDRDGCLDLFICNWFIEYYADGVNDIYSPERLYKGNGDGTFFDVSRVAGIAGLEYHQPSYGASAADVDNDGYPDLFAANYCRGPSLHFKNNGDGTFSEIQSYSNFGKHVGRDHGIWGRTCSWGAIQRDVDNDGDTDLFVILTHGDNDIFSTVLVNDGKGVFTWDFDRFRSRLQDDPDPWHHGDHCAAWIDIDSDGLADLVVSESGYNNNRLYVFHQQEDHSFMLATAGSGLSIVNDQNMPVNAIVAADIDLDGREDLILAGGGDWPVRVFRNITGETHNFIAVTLRSAGGPGFSNVSAIGAQVDITCGTQTITRTIQAGDGHFCPQMPLRLTIGLGNAERVDRLAVTWPNHTRDTYVFADLPVNRHYRLFENPEPVRSGKGICLQVPGHRYRVRDGFILQGYYYPGESSGNGQHSIQVFLEVAGRFWRYGSASIAVERRTDQPEPKVYCFQVTPGGIPVDIADAWVDGLHFHAVELGSSSVY
jgi:hypothetical protein